MSFYGVDPAKRAASQEISELIAAFEANGGRVKRIPAGTMGVSDSTRDALREQLRNVERSNGKEGGESATGDKRQAQRADYSRKDFQKNANKGKKRNPKPLPPKGKDYDVNLCR